MAKSLRKLWKRLNHHNAGKRSRVAHMIAAFKMGLYVKLFITLLFIFRFASHSSQRTYPSAALLPHHHLYNIASAPLSPAMRIIVVSDGAASDNLRSLLHSLAAADYEKDTVALDVWLFASSFCDYFPLPLYPLAVAAFGPPRFDHSIPEVVQSVPWPHGTKSLIARRAEPDLSKLWESSRGTANETLLFVDASVAKSLSRAYYTWLKRTRQAIDRGMIANAGVISLDSVVVPDVVPSTDRAVMLEQFFPATSAFSPTQDVWITFLKWHAMHATRWFAQPSLSRQLNLGGYDFMEALRVQPVRAWFAQFLNLYSERVLHPMLPQSETLLVRVARTTGSRVSGAGVASGVHLDSRSELDANLFDGTLKDTAVPEQPVLVKWNAMVTTADAAYGVSDSTTGAKLRSAVIEDLLSKEGASMYRKVLRRIGEFARSRGTSTVSFTIATASFLETTMSWLCNVAALDIAPPALVIVTSEQKVADELSRFMGQHARLQQGSLIISLDGAVKAIAVADSADAGMKYGTAEYWALTLQRTFLIRDLLEHGLSILHFETDQVWLSDPMPYVVHELKFERGAEGLIEDFRFPDMVVSRSGSEIASDFVYFRPSISTRQLLSTVVERFFASYSRNAARRGAGGADVTVIANDQTLLTALVLGEDGRYRRRYPAVKYRELNSELFVDGRWFLDFEDEQGKRVAQRKFYTSESSLYPVVLNNNFVAGVEAKMERAKRFGFWFVRRAESEDGEWRCDEESVQRAARSGSRKEQREARVVELGRSNTVL
eukprot:TRINITY_DN55567_c0_g1_i1.p1 TRINITY_DN55567_c0_g1~~TRINITY_DN55567_c0_g1_i1.p1  ORF type:complete len:890 (-),score=186.12 TRINITY_DN55567_c0_g1_i1:49-2370(-)